VSVLSAVALGCQSYGELAEQPARIANPDDASRSALQELVNSIFGTDVLLADDAFVNSSLLVIENNPRPSLQNPEPQGRIMAEPMRLRLITTGTDCIVIDDRDGKRYPLPDTTCEAEAAQ